MAVVSSVAAHNRSRNAANAPIISSEASQARLNAMSRTIDPAREVNWHGLE